MVDGELLAKGQSSLGRSFKEKVIQIVSSIPHGKVTSYGTVSSLAGSPRAARMVAGILHLAEGSLPWQRVVNRDGYISIRGCHYDKNFQKKLLESEGVEVSSDFMINLDKYGWWGEEKYLDRS